MTKTKLPTKEKSRNIKQDPETNDIDTIEDNTEEVDPKVVTEEAEIEELLPSARKPKKPGNHIDDILIEMEEERGNWD